jgi:hypothetical protein
LLLLGMKKSFLILHILIFVWMQLLPQNLTAQEMQSRPVPPMPKSYKLPDMHLLDTVRFYEKLRSRIGQRVDVEGFVGRYGATFGNEFRQKIYEIEHQFDEEIEIILTLSSTMDDAKVLQKKLEAHGKKMVIVEIPDWLQQKILADAERKAQQQAGLAQAIWNSGKSIGKLKDPSVVRTMVSNAYKIMKNQYVTPSKRDIKIAAVSVAVADTITGIGLALAVGGLDPLTIAAILTKKALFIGGTALFARTIANRIKSNPFNELKVRTGLGKVIADTTYTVGTKILMPYSNFEFHSEAGSESLYALTESLAMDKKEKKISEKSSDTLFWYIFAYGTTLSILSTLGIGHELIIEQAFFEVSLMRAVQIASMIAFGGLFIYKHKHLEKFAQLHNRELLKANISKLIKPTSFYRPPDVSITLNGLSCNLLFQ